MSKVKILAIITLTAVFFSIPLLSGCGPVKEAVDPIAENILVSMNNQDYESFSKDFDQTMKNSLPAETFPQLLEQVDSQVGKYKEAVNAFEKAIEKKPVFYVSAFENMKKATELCIQQDKIIRIYIKDKYVSIHNYNENINVATIKTNKIITISFIVCLYIGL